MLHCPPLPTTVFDREFHTAYFRTLKMTQVYIQECKLGESISIIEPTVTMQEDSVDQEWFLSVENLGEVEVLNYPQNPKFTHHRFGAIQIQRRFIKPVANGIRVAFCKGLVSVWYFLLPTEEVTMLAYRTAKASFQASWEVLSSHGCWSISIRTCSRGVLSWLVFLWLL